MSHAEALIEIARDRLETGVAAEIGVWRGETSEKLLDDLPLSLLHCVDPYVADPEYDRYANDPRRLFRRTPTQEDWEGLYRATTKHLSRFGTRVRWHRARSRHASLTVPNGSLDFAFVDANHRYWWCKADIDAWTPKIRPGGRLLGHDWFTQKGLEVDGIRWPVQCAVIEAFGDAYELDESSGIWWMEIP